MLNEIRAISYSLKRIEEKKTVYSPLLNFHKTPNKESDFDKDLDTILIKSKLKALILRFAKGPEKSLYYSTSIIASQMRRTLLQNQLIWLLILILNYPKKYIFFFRSGGGRAEYLQAAYSYLEVAVA